MRARLSTAVSRSPNTSRTFPRRSPTTSLLSETSRLFLVNWNHASPYIALTGSSSTEVVSEVVPPLNESFASLYPICCELHSFLVPSFLKNQPRFLPILFLVEVISSTTHFRHIILPSSSWGLKHQSKESYVLITANTYLNIFFKIVRKHPPLSGLPTTSRNCQTNLLSSHHFWNIQLYISEVGRNFTRLA